MSEKADTIAAVATPPGRGGVGIVRVSGPRAFDVAKTLYGPLPQPRTASLRSLVDDQGEVIDEGLLLTFPAPHSFTGEDVVEIQSHGSPVVLNLILASWVAHGVRLAEPGEFSKRAYLNDRLDLVQAESIADLINASTEQAARAAQQSLEGVFSKHVHALVDDLTQLRVYIEASLDFPDEDIDFLADGQVIERTRGLLQTLNDLIEQAQLGERLTTGASVVLVGEPNAGKSSVLNTLARREAAIVTPQAGTTRDVVKEAIQLGGVAIALSDTAGLRESHDPIEQIGIERAREAMATADLLIWVIDAQGLDPQINTLEQLMKTPMVEALKRDYPALEAMDRVLPVINKIDLVQHSPAYQEGLVWMSAKDETGLDHLAQAILERLGITQLGEGLFSARARHVSALKTAAQHLEQGLGEIERTQSAELLAENLKQSAQALGEITGQISADQLLGEIFSSFCIGK